MKFSDYHKSIFLEARRGNTPKEYPAEKLLHYYDTKDDPNLCVSFRNYIEQSIGKTGFKKFLPDVKINPENTYDTPTGIYGYVLKEFNKRRLKEKDFEFATDRPLIYVYTTKPGIRIIRTSNYSQEDYKKDIKILKNIFAKTHDEYTKELININKELDEKEQIAKDNGEIFHRISESGKLKRKKLKKSLISSFNLTDEYIQKLLDDSEDWLKDHNNSYIAKLWALTRNISLQMQISDRRNAVHFWSRLFIEMGIYGVYDDAGTEIIHKNEPIQSVIFGRQYINVIDVLETKTWSMDKHNPSYSLYNNFCEKLKDRKDISKILKIIVEKIKNEEIVFTYDMIMAVVPLFGMSQLNLTYLTEEILDLFNMNGFYKSDLYSYNRILNNLQDYQRTYSTNIPAPLFKHFIKYCDKNTEIFNDSDMKNVANTFIELSGKNNFKIPMSFILRGINMYFMRLDTDIWDLLRRYSSSILSLTYLSSLLNYLNVHKTDISSTIETKIINFIIYKTIKSFEKAYSKEKITGNVLIRELFEFLIPYKRMFNGYSALDSNDQVVRLMMDIKNIDMKFDIIISIMGSGIERNIFSKQIYDHILEEFNEIASIKSLSRSFNYLDHDSGVETREIAKFFKYINNIPVSEINNYEVLAFILFSYYVNLNYSANFSKNYINEIAEKLLNMNSKEKLFDTLDECSRYFSDRRYNRVSVDVFRDTVNDTSSILLYEYIKSTSNKLIFKFFFILFSNMDSILSSISDGYETIDEYLDEKGFDTKDITDVEIINSIANTVISLLTYKNEEKNYKNSENDMTKMEKFILPILMDNKFFQGGFLRNIINDGLRSPTVYVKHNNGTVTLNKMEKLYYFIADHVTYKFLKYISKPLSENFSNSDYVYFFTDSSSSIYLGPSVLIGQFSQFDMINVFKFFDELDDGPYNTSTIDLAREFNAKILEKMLKKNPSFAIDNARKFFQDNRQSPHNAIPLICDGEYNIINFSILYPEEYFARGNESLSYEQFLTNFEYYRHERDYGLLFMKVKIFDKIFGSSMEEEYASDTDIDRFKESMDKIFDKMEKNKKYGLLSIYDPWGYYSSIGKITSVDDINLNPIGSFMKYLVNNLSGSTIPRIIVCGPNENTPAINYMTGKGVIDNKMIGSEIAISEYFILHDIYQLHSYFEETENSNISAKISEWQLRYEKMCTELYNNIRSDVVNVISSFSPKIQLFNFVKDMLNKYGLDFTKKFINENVPIGYYSPFIVQLYIYLDKSHNSNIKFSIWAKDKPLMYSMNTLINSFAHSSETDKGVALFFVNKQQWNKEFPHAQIKGNDSLESPEIEALLSGFQDDDKI